MYMYSYKFVQMLQAKFKYPSTICFRYSIILKFALKNKEVNKDCVGYCMLGNLHGTKDSVFSIGVISTKNYIFHVPCTGLNDHNILFGGSM